MKRRRRDGDVPEKREFVICNRSGGLTNLPDTDARVDTFTYPLFFPLGQLGWHPDLKKAPSQRTRTRITQREYYTYLLMIRPGLFNPILHGKALFQQFAVDAFVKTEQNRLNYLRTHQSDLRTDSYKALQCRITGDQLYQTLNPRQKDACDTILTAVRNGRGGLFFNDGPGGSGKTYLYRTLFNILVGNGKKVMCTAWTGIAATLLPGGRTAASLFKLNIHEQCKTSNLKRQHKDARELAETDVFIWDEASMIHKHALETVDRTLQDMTQVKKLFGGKVFILGGDFRQVLPVVKRGSRGDAIEACIKSSRLWGNFTQLALQTNMRVTSGDAAWTDFLLGVGNGTAKDLDDKVELPQEVKGDGNIVEEVFGASIRAADIDSLAEMAILAPRNCDVDVLNDEVLGRMEGDERKYYSADEVVCEDPADLPN